MNARYRPIDQWPGDRTPPHQRKSRHYFKGTYESTLRLLDTELNNLRATDIVIQLEMQEKDIRLDGLPRSNASPTGPAVILAFDSIHGPLKYATDTFETWHANLRAIALGLEALRKVERYGITKRGEQYTGWKQLGSGIEMPAARMTADDALEFMRVSAGLDYGPDYDDREAIGDAYRQAAKRLHPDAGGSTEQFQRLQEAKRVLESAS